MDTPCASQDAFAQSRERFEEVLAFMGGGQAAALTHAELEAHLEVDGRELLRLLFQDHLDLRAGQEPRAEVIDADGLRHTSVEAGHERSLATVFGEVEVSRLAYRRRGHANLHPADGVLNLPAEKHSHGLRRLAAIEATRGSFDQAVDAVGRSTGQHLGKRQVEGLASRAAADFEPFYLRQRAEGDSGDVLVVSVDGKGIVMRPEALRPATAKAAARSSPKLATRLSKGEKRNRKRMAEVGAVYDVIPASRTPADILSSSHDEGHAVASAPTTRNKWLTASVADDAASVIGQVFDEAERRDPNHRRSWVALVDGANHQIDRITAEAKTRQVTVTIVVDFIHVLEYLWKAAWCFYDEGDPNAERWVHEKASAVLAGQASRVAAAIRRKATCHSLEPNRRSNADTCADYLIRKRPYLDYPTALQQGWPIATGVIEGACRHLVKDRMDITGARWGLEGAEAVLKLRALRTNGDFDNYWQYHLNQEQHRTHETRYADNIIPHAA